MQRSDLKLSPLKPLYLLGEQHWQSTNTVHKFVQTFRKLASFQAKFCRTIPSSCKCADFFQFAIICRHVAVSMKTARRPESSHGGEVCNEFLLLVSCAMLLCGMYSAVVWCGVLVPSTHSGAVYYALCAVMCSCSVHTVRVYSAVWFRRKKNSRVESIQIHFL